MGHADKRREISSWKKNPLRAVGLFGIKILPLAQEMSELRVVQNIDLTNRLELKD